MRGPVTRNEISGDTSDALHGFTNTLAKPPIVAGGHHYTRAIPRLFTHGMLSITGASQAAKVAAPTEKPRNFKKSRAFGAGLSPAALGQNGRVH